MDRVSLGVREKISRLYFVAHLKYSWRKNDCHFVSNISKWEQWKLELLIHIVNIGKKKSEIKLATTKPGRIAVQSLHFEGSTIWVSIMISFLIHSMLQ